MTKLSEEMLEDLMLEHADPRSLERGQNCYKHGAVLDIVRRGEVIHAQVEGSDEEPYNVTVRLGEPGVEDAMCTCPYDWGGWCKHIVAVLLTCVRNPERVEERTPLQTLLSPLDRASLEMLVLNLAAARPELVSEIETQVQALQSTGAPPQSAAIAPPQPAPAAVAPGAQASIAQIRKEVRAALKNAANSGGYGGWDDEFGGIDALEEGVAPLIDMADLHTSAGDGRAALSILDAVTDELIDGWDRVEDIIPEAGDLFGELGGAWAEALLTADLSSHERRGWGDRLRALQRAGASCGADSGLDVAVEAAKQGWDYPPLVRVLHGEITEKGAWEDTAPEWADELANARLNVLERQGRLQEAAYLAEAEGQQDRYLALLVRLGKVKEAASEALETLTTADAALALAKTLQEHSARAGALRVATYGLELPGSRHALATWLRDTALEAGDRDLAIRAGVAAVEEWYRLEDYTRLKEFAEERWPGLRDEILKQLRHSRQWYSATQVDIFLHEELYGDALRAVRDSSDYSLVARVVDAVLDRLPREVIPICKSRAAAIMDAGKADRYHHAARWVQRARDAYRAAGEEAHWRAYQNELLDRYQRKYKLVPLLQAL